MAELKTKPNKASVKKFIESIKDESVQKDCLEIMAMMEKITKEKPTMWGNTIVGFGKYHYRYASGREGDWFQVGFSPRKQSLTVYIISGIGRYPALLAELGKHKTGSGCLYIKNLDSIDRKVLWKIVRKSVADIRKM